MRPAVASLTIVAMALDAGLAVARTGAPSVPVLTLAVVAAVGLAAGRSAGAVLGFVTGVVFDLLAGPASPGGVHALVGMAVGSGAALVRPRLLGVVGAAAVTGPLLVAAAAAATLAMQGLVASGSSPSVESVVAGTLAGAVACPMVVRWMDRPLSERLRTT